MSKGTPQQQYWWGANEEELDLEDALEIADRKRNTDTGLPWKEAVELNKTRDKCILCGNPTIEIQLLVSKIRYCKCVEDKMKS